MSDPAGGGPGEQQLVVTQDCDLNDWETTRTEPLVELGARLAAEDPDTEWAIRSKVLRLTKSKGVHSESAPVRNSSTALVALARPAKVISPASAIAFKTWLGHR